MLTTDVFIQMMNYSIVSCTSIEANLKVLDFCPNILLDGWYIKYDEIENKKTGAGSTLFALFGPEYLSLVPEISRLLPNVKVQNLNNPLVKVALNDAFLQMKHFPTGKFVFKNLWPRSFL